MQMSSATPETNATPDISKNDLNKANIRKETAAIRESFCWKKDCALAKTTVVNTTTINLDPSPGRTYVKRIPSAMRAMLIIPSSIIILPFLYIFFTIYYMTLSTKVLNILIVILTATLAIIIIGNIRIKTPQAEEVRRLSDSSIPTIPQEVTPAIEKPIPCQLPLELSALKSHTYKIKTTFTMENVPETVTDTLIVEPKSIATDAATLGGSLSLVTKRSSTPINETTLRCHSDSVWGFGVPLIVQEDNPSQAQGLSVIQMINKAFNEIPYIPFVSAPVSEVPIQKDVTLSKGFTIHYSYYKKGEFYHITATIPLTMGIGGSPLAGMMGVLPNIGDIQNILPSKTGGNTFTLSYTLRAQDYSLQEAELSGSIESATINSVVERLR
jgi:hypothetical protein